MDSTRKLVKKLQADFDYESLNRVKGITANDSSRYARPAYNFAGVSNYLTA